MLNLYNQLIKMCTLKKLLCLSAFTGKLEDDKHSSPMAAQGPWRLRPLVFQTWKLSGTLPVVRTCSFILGFFIPTVFQPLGLFYICSCLVPFLMILLNCSAVFSSPTKKVTTLLLLQLSLLSTQLCLFFNHLLIDCLVAFIVQLVNCLAITTNIILLIRPSRLLCFFCCFFLHATFRTYGIPGR